MLKEVWRVTVVGAIESATGAEVRAYMCPWAQSTVQVGRTTPLHTMTAQAPENHINFSNLALSLIRLGQPQHAATAAKRCTELAPTFAKGFYRLGQAQRARGELSAAVAAFRAGLVHAIGREETEMKRELAAIEAEAAAAAREGSKGAGGKSKGVAAAEAADASVPTKAKGKVDLEKAVETAKRVAGT